MMNFEHDSVRDALRLAYQWETLAQRAAQTGVDYSQPLGLEPVLEAASDNERALESLLDEAQIPRPHVPDTNWREVLSELSREHPGVQALTEAAMLEPKLEALANQIRASSLTYRELSLNALGKIETSVKS
jgi:hypothetical protein